VIDRLSTLLIAIRDELDDGRVGGRLIAAELASVLFLMLLRLHLEKSPPTIGLVRLLGDEVTSRVVRALIKDLARNWSLGIKHKGLYSHEAMAFSWGTSRRC